MINKFTKIQNNGKKSKLTDNFTNNADYSL